jgi:hypothetical protein
MTKIDIEISEAAKKNLKTFCRVSDLKTDEAVSWLIFETAVPSISRQSKTTRNQKMSISLSDKASKVLSGVCKRTRSSEGVVVDAYLLRRF